MKKVFRHFREFWWFYLAGLMVAYFLIFGPLANYLNKHYTKDITCTVESASTSLRSGGSGGRRSSSFTSIIETKECGRLHFLSTFVKGAGMKDITDRLEEGEKYIFTVNEFELLSGHGVVSGIRDSSGGEIDFSPQD